MDTAKIVAQAGNHGKWRADIDAATARAMLHRKPFVVRHELAGSELFETRQLIEVAREAVPRPGDVYYELKRVK